MDFAYFDAVMDAFRGIFLVLRTPRLWPLCLGPLLGAVTAYVLLGILGGFLIVPRLPRWLGVSGGEQSLWVRYLGSAAFVVLWVVLFSWAFVLLAGVFAGFLFDKLSRAVEQTVTTPGTALPADAPLATGQALGDSLARLVLNASLGVGALLLSFALGPIPGILAAALIGLLDLTSPAYLRQGHTLGKQAARLFRSRDANTFFFALVAGMLSLVPLIGVLLLPGLVAGGTLLARRHLDREG